MKLSENFYLSEFLHSDTAERSGGAILAEQLNPPPEIVESIKYQVTKLWQPCRTALGASFKVGSGYRCKALNAITPGSSNTSQHTTGEAGDMQMSEKFLVQADFLKAMRDAIESVTNKKVRVDVNSNFYLFAYICLNLESLDVDQVIHEFGTDGRPAWVHGSASMRTNRRQILAKRTGAGYQLLSVKEALLLGC